MTGAPSETPKRALFEELDYQPTELGLLTLRRRVDLSTGQDIHEIKLGDEFLMSSKFVVSEEALATVAIDSIDGDRLNILIGGLGLGYTARAALRSPRVENVIVIEALEPVIQWHREGLLPLGREITRDSRLRLVNADFFACARDVDIGFGPETPKRKYDAILLDIDHSPDQFLNVKNGSFYSFEGLVDVSGHLTSRGVFAMWSNDRPDPAFTERLRAAFGMARAEQVTFYNPLQENEATQCIYLAWRPGDS